MTTRETFKAAFLARCAEEGLTIDETKRRVQNTMKKIAAWPMLAALTRTGGNVVSSVAPVALTTAILAGLGIPILAGAAGGHTLAKTTGDYKSDDLTTDKMNVYEARADEIIAEYKRLAEDAKKYNVIKSLG